MQAGRRRPTSQDVLKKELQRWRAALRLRRAVARGQVVVYFQPKVCLRTGLPTGVEALMRRRHPKRGLESPATLLCDVRCRSALHRLTSEVLAQALPVARRLCVPVAVNVPPIVLGVPGFVAEVAALLDRAGVAPEHLTIEITEELDAADPDVLDELHAMGVRLSIDDFGVGASSLDRLKRLPVDELKLDRSFVQEVDHDENDALIVALVTAIASCLGTRVVAEGVERPAVAEQLLAEGCDEAQGFLYAPALPPAELEAWLTSRAAFSAASSWRSTSASPLAQNPGSARSIPTSVPSSSGDREPPARSRSRYAGTNASPSSS
jgi:EAL domain-containing protein (putative c-di-GMP-specific phosphodiesterase class I)